MAAAAARTHKEGRLEPLSQEDCRRTNVHFPINGNPITEDNSLPSSPESSSSSSSSSSASDEEESGSDGSDSSNKSETTILREAGVEMNWDSPGEATAAPLELLSEFVSCCVRNKYRAASILCQKILKIEPDNSTALEFLPVLQERLRLDKELPTESSSSDSEGSEEDSSPQNEG